MATVANLRAVLDAQTGTFTRKIQQAQRPVNRLRSVVGRLGAAIGGIFAARSVIRGTADVLRAFQRQEDAVMSLQAALSVTGKEGAESLRLLTQRAAELQRVTTKGDEAIIAATASLVQLATELQPAELARAQEAIVGIADTFLRGDVENAALLLGKSIGSTTNALTRYGIQIDTSASQSEKLNQVLQQSARFFQVSQARAESSAGRLQQLANAWGDLKEAIGGGITRATGLSNLVEQATQAVQDLTTLLSGGQFVEAFRAAGEVLGNAFGAGYIRALLAMQEQLFKAILPDRLADLLLRYTPLALSRGAGTLIANQFERNLQDALARLRALAIAAPPGAGTPTLGKSPFAAPGAPIVGATVPMARMAEATRTFTLRLTDLDTVLMAGQEHTSAVTARLEEQANAQAHLRDVIQGGTAVIAESAARNIGYAVESVARGMGNISSTIIQSITNIVQTVVAELRQIQIARAAASGSSAGFLGGPWGALLGIGVGVLGGVIGAFSRSRAPEPVPVRVDSYSSQALRQQRQVGPSSVSYYIYDASGNVYRTEHNLKDRSRRDAVERIVPGTGFAGGSPTSPQKQASMRSRG